VFSSFWIDQVFITIYCEIDKTILFEFISPLIRILFCSDSWITLQNSIGFSPMKRISEFKKWGFNPLHGDIYSGIYTRNGETSILRVFLQGISIEMPKTGISRDNYQNFV